MPPMVLPTKEGAGRGPRYAPEAPPPKGERNRKLVDDGCIVAAREERLLDIWCRKLQEELLEMEAPIIGTLRGSLDPDRAALLLVGKTRASTLKRYLSYYRQWRLWLAEAKLRYPPCWLSWRSWCWAGPWARYRLEGLGLGQAPQGLGVAKVVRPASYNPR